LYIKNNKTIAISFLLGFFILSGCSSLYTFVEYEHISSVTYGKPFNSKAETSTDILFTGVRYKDNGVTVDIGFGNELSSDLEGDNPYAKVSISKEIKINSK